MTDDPDHVTAPTRRIGQLGTPEQTARRTRYMTELNQVLMVMSEHEVKRVLDAARELLKTAE